MATESVDNKNELGTRSERHKHDWIIVYDNIRYRDIDGTENIIDIYKCACGAGGRVVTPKAVFDTGNKKLGIEDL